MCALLGRERHFTLHAICGALPNEDGQLGTFFHVITSGDYCNARM